MNSEHPVVAVVPAAGIGSRMQADRPKQYLTLAGKTILEHTLERLISHPQVSRVVVAISPDDPFFSALSISGASWLTCVNGGNSRADSVLAAVTTLQANEWAMVHDAARPCLTHEDLNKLIAIMDDDTFAGGILATPVRDTMKRANSTNGQSLAVQHTECRENLWHALTPQLFQAGQLAAALESARKLGLNITDEASAMEAAGYRVALVDASPANIKITRPADLPLAQFYLQQLSTFNDKG